MKNFQWKLCLTFSFIVFVLFLVVAREVLTLPSFERLFRRKYKYKASCSLCHSQGGGSALGPYGKDFKRRGMSFLSFGKLEDLDSDKDGFKNLAEIVAKSNPGDAKSTPDTPGDWLERIEEEFIPREQLVEIYPKARSFSIIEGALNDKQIRAIESQLGRTLTDQEAVPTFYFAFVGKGKDAKRIGLAMFASPPGKKGRMSIGIGISLKGSVNKIIIYKGKEDKKVFHSEFLTQFEGKNLKDPLKIGQDIKAVSDEEDLSVRFSESVKCALLTMYQVFSRR